MGDGGHPGTKATCVPEPFGLTGEGKGQRPPSSWIAQKIACDGLDPCVNTSIGLLSGTLQLHGSPKQINVRHITIAYHLGAVLGWITILVGYVRSRVWVTTWRNLQEIKNDGKHTNMSITFHRPHQSKPIQTNVAFGQPNLCNTTNFKKSQCLWHSETCI